MLFTPSEDQALFNQSLEQALLNRLDLVSRARVAAGPVGYDPEAWATAAELGWIGGFLSEQDGGFGDGVGEVVLLFQAFGAALTLEPFLDCALLPLRTLAEVSGAEAEAEIASLIDGGRKLILLDRQDSSEGGFKAERQFDGSWRITGSRPVVQWAEAADAFLVQASCDDGQGDVLIKVDAAAAGVSLASMRLIDQSRASDVSFDDVTAPDDAIIARGPEAEAAVTAGLTLSALAVCSEAVGAMDRCVWMTRDYLNVRKQFGQPLGRFQALQHRMADMVIELELARAMVRRCAVVVRNGNAPEARQAVSACKVTVAKAGRFIAENAIQLHGAIGVTDEYAIGHYYKRILTISTRFGDSTDHLRRFAGL